MNVKKHLALLGLRVEDRVTGCTGVVTSIGFDLYGCIQAIVHPGMGNDQKMRESLWFDISRLKVLSTDPVVTPPDYDFGDVAEGKKGPAEKPSAFKN